MPISRITLPVNLRVVAVGAVKPFERVDRGLVHLAPHDHRVVANPRKAIDQHSRVSVVPRDDQAVVVEPGEVAVRHDHAFRPGAPQRIGRRQNRPPTGRRGDPIAVAGGGQRQRQLSDGYVNDRL